MCRLVQEKVKYRNMVTRVSSSTFCQQVQVQSKNDQDLTNSNLRLLNDFQILILLGHSMTFKEPADIYHI